MSSAPFDFSNPRALSNIADPSGGTEGREPVRVGGEELVGQVALKPGIRDGLADTGVVDLLRVVQFVAARDAAGMEMTNGCDVLPDGVAEVALHDLHVKDIKEQLEVV